MTKGPELYALKMYKIYMILKGCQHLSMLRYNSTLYLNKSQHLTGVALDI